MKTSVFLLLALCLLLAGCVPNAPGTPAASDPTPTTDLTTATPAATMTPLPLPATDLPLDLDPTDDAGLPTLLPAGPRGFQFAQPDGFRVKETANKVLLENEAKNILITLELFEHQGQSNAAVFLRAMTRESIYNPIEASEPYELSGYKGWAANVEAPGIYEDGTGQIIVVDVDAARLFYAFGLAKGEELWQGTGQPIFQQVLDSVTFPVPAQ